MRLAITALNVPHAEAPGTRRDLANFSNVKFPGVAAPLRRRKNAPGVKDKDQKRCKPTTYIFLILKKQK